MKNRNAERWMYLWEWGYRAGLKAGQAMIVSKTERGFPIIELPSYANEPVMERLVQQSSAVGPYDDAFERPGTSFLWVGQDHHLDREEVRDLIGHLQGWVDTGRLGGQS